MNIKSITSIFKDLTIQHLNTFNEINVQGLASKKLKRLAVQIKNYKRNIVKMQNDEILWNTDIKPFPLSMLKTDNGNKLFKSTPIMQ